MTENLLFMIMVVTFIIGIATKHELVTGGALLMTVCYVLLTHFGFFSKSLCS